MGNYSLSTTRDVLYFAVSGFGITPQYLLFNILLTVVGIAIFVLNSFVAYVMTRQRHNLDATYIFIANLAISDAMCGLLLLYNVTYNLIHYKLFYECLFRFGTLHSILMNSSINLFALTFDRYVKISFPFMYWTIFKEEWAKYFTILAWIVSVLFGLLPLFGWNKYNTDPYCGYFGIFSETYLLVFISVVVVVFAVVFFMYVRILLIALSKQVTFMPLRSNENCSCPMSRNDITMRQVATSLWWKPTKVILLIIALNTLCIAPVGVYIPCVTLGVLDAIDDGQKGTLLLYFSGSVFIYSLVNPIVYAYKIPVVRKAFRELFKYKINAVHVV